MSFKTFLVIAVLLAVPTMWLTFTWDIDLERPVADDDRRMDVPEWRVSDYWTFEIEREDGTSDVVTMAVYDDDGTNYLVGVDSRDEALYHALYNVNPMLGRVQKQDLAVYENGRPKAMYDFPLAPGNEYTADLVDEEAAVTYDFDGGAGWFTHYTVTDADGLVYSMVLRDHGTGFTGQVWFMRARDLYSAGQKGEGVVTMDVDSFEVGEHPTYGPYDLIAYNVEVRTGTHGLADVTILDSGDAIVFQDGVSSDGRVSTTLANEGRWRVVVNVIGDAEAEVTAAGVIEYTATL